MALQVWLPLNGNLNNQGIDNTTVTNNGATVDNNGKIGKCYSFNGSSNYLRINEKLIDNAQYTISFWMYATNVTANQCIYSSRNVSNGAVNIYLLSTGLRFDYGTNWVTGFKPTANTWYHITFVQDATKIYLYVNGVLNTSTTATTTLSQVSSIATIGCEHINGSSIGTYYIGKLNDFRIYNHALSPKEIEVLSRGLVCHYPLEGANNTLLPFGYQQLEYIESAGAAYFDTGYKFNPETDSFKVTFKGNDTSNNGMILGDNGTYYIWLYYYGSNGIKMYAKHSSQQGTSGILSDLNKHTAEYKNKHYWIDGVDKGGFTETYTEDSITMSVFSYGGANYVFKGRIYFVDISRNGVSQRIYIPAKRISDSKIGMYDLVNNTFTPSASSTAFTAGTVIGTPSTVYDTSGYKYNGTMNGALTVSADTPRYSLSTYIPASGYIRHSRALDNSNQEWTCCAWVKLDGTTNYQLMNNFNLGNAIRHSSTPLLYLNSGSNDYYRYGSVAVPASTWTHIAFVFKNSVGQRDIYVNGVLTNSSGPNATSTPAGIPDNVDIFGQNFAGYASDYREYATALSADQIKELYNTAVSVSNNGTLLGYELVEV